jgi:hypothetical protein
MSAPPDVLRDDTENRGPVIATKGCTGLDVAAYPREAGGRKARPYDAEGTENRGPVVVMKGFAGLDVAGCP